MLEVLALVLGPSLLGRLVEKEGCALEDGRAWARDNDINERR